MGMKPRMTLRQKVAKLESDKAVLIHKQYSVRTAWAYEREQLIARVKKLQREIDDYTNQRLRARE